MIDVAAPGVNYWNIARIVHPALILTLLKELPGIVSEFFYADKEHKNMMISSLFRSFSLLYRFPSQLIFPGRKSKIEYPEWINHGNPEGYLRDTAIRNHILLQNYKPRKFDGKVTLFTAVSKYYLGYIYRIAFPKMGWDLFANDVESISINGDHPSMMNIPQAIEISNHIEKCLLNNERNFT
jgi:hypothetical protein